MSKVTITIESEASDDVTVSVLFDPPADNEVPAPASHIVAMRMLNAMHNDEFNVTSSRWIEAEPPKAKPS